MSYRTVVAVLVAAAGGALAGCGGICEDYCEHAVACMEELLDDQGGSCSYEDSHDDLLADCVPACEKGLEAVAPDDQGEFENCAECIVEATGDEVCEWQEVYDASEGTCEEQCDNERMEDASQDFYEELAEEWSPDVECGQQG